LIAATTAFVVVLLAAGAAKGQAAAQSVVRIATADDNTVGASVKIDGLDVGKIPTESRLAPGRHLVEVSKSGFEPWSRWYELEGGESRDIELILKPKAPATPATPPQPAPPAKGGLRIETVPPGAQTFVDTRPVGLSPVEVGDLPPGAHTVVVQAAGRTMQQQIAVVAGQQTPVRIVVLTPPPATPVPVASTAGAAPPPVTAAPQQPTASATTPPTPQTSQASQPTQGTLKGSSTWIAGLYSSRQELGTELSGKIRETEFSTKTRGNSEDARYGLALRFGAGGGTVFGLGGSMRLWLYDEDDGMAADKLVELSPLLRLGLPLVQTPQLSTELYALAGAGLSLSVMSDENAKSLRGRGVHAGELGIGYNLEGAGGLQIVLADSFGLFFEGGWQLHSLYYGLNEMTGQGTTQTVSDGTLWMGWNELVFAAGLVLRH